MITILGSGGHGWQSLSQFIINNSQNEKNTEPILKFNFVVGTTDWGKTDFGGFNGTWGRILEFFEEDFGKTNNQILHPIKQEQQTKGEISSNKKKENNGNEQNNKNILPTKLTNYQSNYGSNYQFPVLPFGDVNKIVGYFWTQNLQNSQKNQKIEEKEEKLENLDLDLRSDNLEILLELWYRINRKIDLEFRLEFEIYLKNALQIYQKIRNKLNLKARNPSLLHFWHTFLMYKSTLVHFQNYHQENPQSQDSNNKYEINFNQNFGVHPQNNLEINSPKNAEIFAKINQIFNSLCHTFEILPSNILVNFGDCERRILAGSDGELAIIGEENLDEWHKPILPQSLQIKTKNLQKPTIYEPLLKNLKNSDLVIIPTGSVANWLGFVNNSQVLSALRQKNLQNKLIWVQNNEQNLQEFSVEIYQKYLEDLELKPLIIKTKNLQKDEARELVAQKLVEIIKS